MNLTKKLLAFLLLLILSLTALIVILVVVPGFKEQFYISVLEPISNGLKGIQEGIAANSFYQGWIAPPLNMFLIGCGSSLILFFIARSYIKPRIPLVSKKQVTTSLLTQKEPEIHVASAPAPTLSPKPVSEKVELKPEEVKKTE